MSTTTPLLTLLALTVAAAAAVAGCGESDEFRATDSNASVVSLPATVQGTGLTVELPPGWQSAPAKLTPHLTDPREVLAVGTYPLQYRPTSCAFVAGSALQDLKPSDAFVTLQERGTMASAPSPDAGASSATFRERPEHFGPELGGPSMIATRCAPGARFAEHWFTFSDGGRRFQAQVAFGPAVTSQTREQAWAILDGLRVDPDQLPGWESSG